MKRKMIQIDEKKCNGCGDCVPNCPEGTLQIIDGKARLVSDLFCDGLGACIGHCPQGAIAITEREAEPYDERKVMQNIIAAGPNTIRAHLQHLEEHGEDQFHNQAIEILHAEGIEIPLSETPANPCQGGQCPGSATQSFPHSGSSHPAPPVSQQNSQLSQWPVQLKLLNPSASYFDKADLLICADCVPFAYANFHERFVKGRIVITFCPKLDQTIEQYIRKLASIVEIHEINSITIVRMELPCCGGIEIIVQRALELAGKSKMVKVSIISIQGEIL